MTERIDHAAEAIGWMDNAQHNEETVEQASLSLGFAQVHATLALAEQQRIANIIALGQFSLRVSDSEILTTKFESAKKWHDYAVKSLGL